MGKIEISLNKTNIFFHNCSAFLFTTMGVFQFAEIFIFNISDDRIITKFFTVVGIMFILFFVPKFIYGTRKMFDKSAGLIIDENGITDNSSAISAGLIKWDDIKEIKKKPTLTGKLLIDTKNPGQYIDRKKGIEKIFIKLKMKTKGTALSINTGYLDSGFNELYAYCITQHKKYLKKI